MSILDEIPSEINQILPFEKSVIPHSEFRTPHLILPLLPSPGFGVQKIIQPVSHQAKTQDGQENGDPGKGHRPPGLTEVDPGRHDHESPAHLFCVFAAVNRITRNGEILGPEYRLTPEQALRAVTIDAAWQTFDEKMKGSIEVGKLADFTILAENPPTVVPGRIKDIEVEDVIIGGGERIPS